MKRTFIFSAAVLCSLYVLLASNSEGPASMGNGIRNGGPGSNGTCGSCHSGGAGSTTVAISLKEKASGTAASGSYKPGVIYTVTISGNNASLAFFGFQLTATTQGNVQAGNFGNFGSDKHMTPLNGLQVIEHSTNLSKTNGEYNASFDWIAPAAGTGTVTFYGIINAVNNNDQDNGDRPSPTTSLALTEASTSSLDETKKAGFGMYPNPANDMLYVSPGKSGAYTISVTDLNGRELLRRRETAQGQSAVIALPLHQLPSGTYFVRVNSNGQTGSRLFIKR